MPQNATADYYEILQISPRADQETIERVYRLLAKRYHPDNKVTGDEQKFNILINAYRVLSDPEKRAAYDASHESASTQQWGEFLQMSPGGGAEQDIRINQAVLSLLYKARRRDAEKPAIGVVEIERLLGVPEQHLSFHMWYLKEKKWIKREETGGFSITVDGVDEVIKKGFPMTSGLFLEEPPKPKSGTENPAKEKQP
jgi:curved DNA-binding protein